MILAAYITLAVATGLVLIRHFRGRLVASLFFSPPEGSDLRAIVGYLAQLEHELIKHRVPVVRGLAAKGAWNDEDFDLLQRTVGTPGLTILDEFRSYQNGIQRGAGRTLVNFDRDRAFWEASRRMLVIQREGERWLRGMPSTPSAADRRRVDEAAAWLAGPFRRFLIELSR
ncbi:MAG: hypothetical protein KC561_14815, partial [Myxococcales bacterium]|nr:hypothetical protein [Myxococcales bacterium]